MTATMRTSERILLGIALMCGSALPILALVAPAYSGDSVDMSSDGTTVIEQSSATLVQENGWQVLIGACAPLAAAVLVTVLLSLRTRRRWPVITAWVITGLLAVGTALALLTIGIVILPVTACLVAACTVHGSGVGSRPAPPFPAIGSPGTTG